MPKQTKHPDLRPPVVLLVDDQALVAQQVKLLLKSEPDIALHYCQDPALAIVKALEVKPTIILLDLIMPNIDGMTLCRVLRAAPETADLAIVILSSTNDSESKAQAFAAGANDYLVKLPDAIEFNARIRYHSNNYLLKIGRDEAYAALCQSQAELELANKHLQKMMKMAYQDKLTELPNRSMLMDRVSMAMAEGRRNKKLVAILFCDLDGFKQVNDLFSHQAGDDVLKVVAHRLVSCVRGTDTVARLGGDEFVVVLGNLDDKQYVTFIAEKIIEAIAQPIPLNKGKQAVAKIGISIGTSIYPSDGEDIERLFAFADHAMYASKRMGKNRNCFFDHMQIAQKAASAQLTASDLTGFPLA